MGYEYKLQEVSKISSNLDEIISSSLAEDIKNFRVTLEKKMETQYEKCENENIYGAKLDDYFKMKADKVLAFAMSFEHFIRLIDQEATREEHYQAESLFKDWLRAKGDLTKMLAMIYQLERGYAYCLKKPVNEETEKKEEGNENTN